MYIACTFNLILNKNICIIYKCVSYKGIFLHDFDFFASFELVTSWRGRLSYIEKKEKKIKNKELTLIVMAIKI